MITDEKKYKANFTYQDDITIPANCCMSCIYAGSLNKDIFESLCKIINSVDNMSIKTQLSTFCNCLSDRLQKVSYCDKLPILQKQIESDEVFLEWIFSEFRLGFLFCDDPDDSGWNLVVNTPDGVRSSSNRFNGDIPTSVINIIESILRLA